MRGAEWHPEAHQTRDASVTLSFVLLCSRGPSCEKERVIWLHFEMSTRQSNYSRILGAASPCQKPPSVRRMKLINEHLVISDLFICTHVSNNEATINMVGFNPLI